MKELANQLNDQVAGFKDNSSELRGEKYRVTFKNGHDISIIRGEYSYGGEEGLYEIMPSDSSVLGEDHTDTVMGYLTPEQVMHYASKVAQLPTKEI